MISEVYLKLGFKKAQEGSRNNASNATTINAQHRHHLSLCKTSRHLYTFKRAFGIVIQVSFNKLMSINVVYQANIYSQINFKLGYFMWTQKDFKSITWPL